MCIAIAFLFAILFIQPVLAQSPSKTQKPARNELQGQMAQAINELNKQIIDLEKQVTDAKRTKEDELVIKDLENQVAMLKKQVEMMGGVTKNMSKVSDKTFQQAIKDDDNISLPKLDAARIKQLPDKILSDAELVPYVKKIHSEVEKLMNEKNKAEALSLYNALKLEKKSSGEINNIAAALWLSGDAEIALFLSGKACATDMGNINNLSNYAAFLTMKGGEHAALPILQNLNERFPNNSTILNNMGQAWYGLGDMSNANMYLDDVVRIYRNHSQANQTKSEIQRSQGQTQESIESLKRSMEENYTPEKEARLNELGYKVKFEDVKFKYPVKAEPLGIEQFMFSIPAYPFEGGMVAETSRKEWYDFKTKLSAALQSLRQIKQDQQAKVDAHHKRVLVNPQILKPYNNAVYKTAKRKLDLLTEWGIERMLALNEEFMADAQIVSQLKETYNNALKNTEACGARKGLATSFMSQANVIWQDNNAKMLSLQKQIINAGSNYALYAFTDRSEYELVLTSMKIGFLAFLSGLHAEFEVGCLATESPEPRRGPLPDFDEMNCEYKTELSVPYLEKFFSIKVECNKMTTTFDAKFIKGSLDENLATGKYKGTVEIEVKIGSDKINVGPVEVGSSVKAGAGVDFTESGIQDVYITSEAQIKAGAVTAGSIEAKVSVISGNTTIIGKGALSGINTSIK